jgi:type I restriction enzyme, R subunit
MIHYRAGRQCVSLLPRCREMRRAPTPAEKVLWEMVRGRKFEGLKFRRQHQIGPYIVDFYCDELRLAIELDGDHHLAPKVAALDAERTAFIEAAGVYVVRFPNDALLAAPNRILDCLRDLFVRRPR